MIILKVIKMITEKVEIHPDKRAKTPGKFSPVMFQYKTMNNRSTVYSNLLMSTSIVDISMFNLYNSYMYCQKTRTTIPLILCSNT